MIDHSKWSEEFQKPFPKAEIEWRIARAFQDDDKTIKAKCLAYVTARAVQNRLDEVVGMTNWEIKFDVDHTSKTVLCTIRIRIQGEHWVEKTDGADMTDIEAFKGGLSSAMKRAAVQWGIGRYLYGLDEGKAIVYPKYQADAHYQPKNEKKKIPAFYWNPPALPDWALTEEEKGKSAALAAQKVPNPLAKPETPPEGGVSGPTSDECKRLFGVAKKRLWTADNVRNFVKTTYNASGLSGLTREQFEDMKLMAENLTYAQAQEEIRTRAGLNQ